MGFLIFSSSLPIIQDTLKCLLSVHRFKDSIEVIMIIILIFHEFLLSTRPKFKITLHCKIPIILIKKNSQKIKQWLNILIIKKQYFNSLIFFQDFQGIIPLSSELHYFIWEVSENSYWCFPVYEICIFLWMLLRFSFFLRFFSSLTIMCLGVFSVFSFAFHWTS